jgi:glucan phosphoethanolaminetransferase (alkaline phosphatase superfamily)
MGFCGSTFKFLVFLFNFIFFLAGVAIIGLGSYMAINMKDYFDFLSTSDLAPNVGVSSYIFIVVGVIVAIIAFLGCCAACTDNKCMMGSYAVLMMLILIAELGVAITILIYKDKAKMVASDAMVKGLENYNKTGYEGVTKTWDEIQQRLKCCGVDTPQDWKNATELGNNNAPKSCCKIEADHCV